MRRNGAAHYFCVAVLDPTHNFGSPTCAYSRVLLAALNNIPYVGASKNSPVSYFCLVLTERCSSVSLKVTCPSLGPKLGYSSLYTLLGPLLFCSSWSFTNGHRTLQRTSAHRASPQVFSSQPCTQGFSFSLLLLPHQRILDFFSQWFPNEYSAL